VFDLLTYSNRDTLSLFGQTDVADVWGIGKAHSAFLHGRGIKTALQLRQADDHFIRTHMGIVGLRLVMELRGLRPLFRESHYPPAGHGRSGIELCHAGGGETAGRAAGG
jgi:nucleotidyltransferase/DNA polymerase involved in DNA repair